MRFFVLLPILVLLVAGCTSQPTNPDPKPPDTGPEPVSAPPFLKGVSLSPKSFGGSDFADFFPKAKQAGGLLTWAGPWEQLSDPAGAPAVTLTLGKQQGLEVGIITELPPEDVNNQAKRDAFSAAILAFAEKHKPVYLGLGNELNRDTDAQVTAFASLFAELAPEIKRVSPHTLVFPVFQYEEMKGLQGGLFGKTNDPANAEWGMLSVFPDAELIAFTTYPGLIYKDPADIPADYYREAAGHINKPLAYAEVGWFRTGPVGWESSVEEQAAFIERFFSLTGGNSRFSVWPFLYDQPVPEPATTMGLLQKIEETSAAWEAWLAG